jgi:hypothetical protein
MWGLIGYDAERDPIRDYVSTYDHQYAVTELAVWALAIGLHAGDTLTTVAIVIQPGGFETTAAAIVFLRTFGPPGLVLHKLLFLGGIYVLFRAFPKPYRLVFPALLAYGAIEPVVNNLGVLSELGVL